MPNNVEDIMEPSLRDDYIHIEALVGRFGREFFYDVPFIFEGILRKSACLNFVLTALSSVADARAYGKRRPALKVGSEDEYHIMALENISPLRRVFRLN